MVHSPAEGKKYFIDVCEETGGKGSGAGTGILVALLPSNTFTYLGLRPETKEQL
jgi:hypothetical protein